MQLSKPCKVGIGVGFCLGFLIVLVRQEASYSTAALVAEGGAAGLGGALVGFFLGSLVDIVWNLKDLIKKRGKYKENSERPETINRQISKTINGAQALFRKKRSMVFSMLLIAVTLAGAARIYVNFIPRALPNKELEKLSGRGGFQGRSPTFRARVHNETDYEIHQMTISVEIMNDDAKWPNQLSFGGEASWSDKYFEKKEHKKQYNYDEDIYKCNFDQPIEKQTVSECEAKTVLDYGIEKKCGGA